MSTQVRQAVEIWKNVAAGMRYYRSLDAMGRETTSLVQAGRTFSLTPLERQLNQEMAASKQLDMFLNGTFLLVQASDDTNMDEIQSPNSITDREIVTVVQETKGGDLRPLKKLMKLVDSYHTAQRILEELVVEDAPQSAVSLAKQKVEELTEKPNVPMVDVETVSMPGPSPSAQPARPN